MRTCEVEIAATMITIIDLLFGLDLIDDNMGGEMLQDFANLT